MEKRVKFVPDPQFSDPQSEAVIKAINNILLEDLEYSKEMQDSCYSQAERLAWQTRIMHCIDLMDQIRCLYAKK